MITVVFVLFGKFAPPVPSFTGNASTGYATSWAIILLFSIALIGTPSPDAEYPASPKVKIISLDDGEITFYKNGSSQGVAFTDLI